jgi:hypothetical protein
MDRRNGYALRVKRGSSWWFSSVVPVAACVALPVFLFGACEPRNKKTAAAPTATVTGTATAQPTTAPTPTSTAPPPMNTATIGIPGLPYGLPVSPRSAIVGRWNVAAIDGKAVPSAGMGTDPMDPTTYAAGSGVVFSQTQVALTRSGSPWMTRDYKVLSEQAPVRVTIDAGYGPSNIDFSPDGTVIWSLPSTPPHALTLTRAP